MSRRRTGRGAAREAAPSHERWLVSYADFMTLLFALFVVLFASSYRDSKAIKSVAAAVRNGFVELGTFAGGGAGGATHNQTLPAVHPPSGIDLVELNRKLNKALGKEIERKEINTRSTPEGYVISLHELGFFDSGQASLQAGAAEKLQKIAAVLNQYGLDMRVEGHSDNIPIHNQIFNSNWELSTARATAVAKMLIEKSGVPPEKIAIAGYGQYHPAAGNDTPEGRAANRRVDIVIIGANENHAK